MGRLIDADKLKNILTVAEYPCALQNMLIEIIDMQPTDYDVDAVEEQLKCDDCKRCSFCEVCAGSVYCGKCHERAIEIVKGGGIDDNR